MPEPKRSLDLPDPMDPLLDDKRINHALVIGIDTYEDEYIDNLEHPVSDCKKLVELLCSRFTFEQKNIHTLYNAQASRKQIREAFIHCITELGPEDNLLIFYAGHGVWNEVLEWGYWVPTEARSGEIDDYLGNEEVVDLVEKINTQHTVFIADSCFSGDFFDRKRSGFGQITGARSRWAISSGRLEAVSDNSPFFAHLMRVLTDTEDDILVSDLANQVKIATASSSRSQQTPRGEPMMIEGHEGGEFLFRLRENLLLPKDEGEGDLVYSEERSLEAALPQKMRVGEESLLTVLIRHHSQESLASIVAEDEKFGVNPEEVESEEFIMDFKRDSQNRILAVGLILVLEASHFDLPVTQRRVRIKPGKNSSLITFLCTPKREGKLLLTLQVYYEEELIGSGILQAEGIAQTLINTEFVEERFSMSLGRFSDEPTQGEVRKFPTNTTEEGTSGSEPDVGFESTTQDKSQENSSAEDKEKIEEAVNPPPSQELPDTPRPPKPIETPDLPLEEKNPADIDRASDSGESHGEVSHMKGGCLSVFLLL
ncbi:MAG: caspase family protein, partial [Bacteroidota bacterium]